jgi:hypothetical protein
MSQGLDLPALTYYTIAANSSIRVNNSRHILRVSSLQHVYFIHPRTHCVAMRGRMEWESLADPEGAASERDLRDGVDWGAKWVVLAQRCFHGGCCCLDGPRPALSLFAMLSPPAT